MMLKQMKREKFLLHTVEVFKQSMLDFEIPEFDRFKKSMSKLDIKMG